ncbi:transposase domain-containing protein [Ligilactobacillus ruminis]
MNCPTTAQSALSKRAWWGEKTGCFHQLLKAQGLMPLVYTAKLNQLDPEKYLRKVLTKITNIEVFDPERLRHLLP